MHGGFVDDGVLVLGNELLGDVKRLGLEVARGVEPGFCVLVGGIDYQRIAIPVADRVALEQMKLGIDMRTPICGNDAHRVHELRKLDEVAGCLNNLNAELIRFAVRDARLITMQFRLIRHVAFKQIFLLGSGRFGVRNMAIGGIDNPIAPATAETAETTTAPGRWRAARATRCRGSTGRSTWCAAATSRAARGSPTSTAAASCRRFNIGNRRRIPEALHIRMPVGKLRHGSSRGLRRTTASSAFSATPAALPTAVFAGGRTVLPGPGQGIRRPTATAVATVVIIISVFFIANLLANYFFFCASDADSGANSWHSYSMRRALGFLSRLSGTLIFQGLLKVLGSVMVAS